MALGIDDCINKTPAAKPDKLKKDIRAKPIKGPIITLPVDVTKASLNEKTFICVRETPRDIKIITIIPYAKSITVFKTNIGKGIS